MINKNIIVGIIFSLLLTQQAFASNWKHIENNKTNKASIYLQTNTIKKDGAYATYTTRLKMKNVGDYINVVYTNCSDFSSATLGTYEYADDFSTSYESLSIPRELTSLDKTSLLYNVAPIACISEHSYNVVKPKKENKFVKVIKGIGIGIGYILIAPFALLALVLGAS